MHHRVLQAVGAQRGWLRAGRGLSEEFAIAAMTGRDRARCGRPLAG